MLENLGQQEIAYGQCIREQVPGGKFVEDRLGGGDTDRVAAEGVEVADVAAERPNSSGVPTTAEIGSPLPICLPRTTRSDTMSYRWKAHQRVPARPKSACTSSAIREPDQIGRREQFLRDHPGSRIYPLELGGAIQAEVPDGKTGERLIRSRYTLKELLDVLDEALPVGR